VVNRAGDVWEVQLKGAGPTPYSRRADGRAVMRSSLRELVCSEAMFHLGIPTTRALSLVATGEAVQRDLMYDGNTKLEPGAVVCRVAPSFLRFGSYEVHAAREDTATLRALVQFTLARFYPHHVHGDRMDIPAFLDEVARLTAWMVCEWMRVGFVHGVMNTDNMSILGLTIDYGPYGWIEPFDLDWTPNITDASGRRYRFGAQPQIALWNIAQLARALAPLVDDAETLRPAIRTFEREITQHYRHTMLRKLGLAGRRDTQLVDDELLADLGSILTAVETDMTLWFRRLADIGTLADARALDDAYYALDDVGPVQRAAVATWLRTYLARAAIEGDHATRRVRMNEINPLYVPRNYLVQEVIEGTEAGDRSALAELLDVLRRPYDEQPGRARYTQKRPEWARVKPGCSMLSCSS
jgi:uncharacterized protein YdiU (UPF0061 family)